MTTVSVPVLDMTASKLRLHPLDETTLRLRIGLPFVSDNNRAVVQVVLQGAHMPVAEADVRTWSNVTWVVCKPTVYGGDVVEIQIEWDTETATANAANETVKVQIDIAVTASSVSGAMCRSYDANQNELQLTDERWIWATATPEKSIETNETKLRVLVDPRAGYMMHLPGIYHDQPFLSRLLMAFEAMWRPNEKQIEHGAHLFDPSLVPVELLDWLGAWVGMSLNRQWPERKQRDMIKHAMQLYRLRGTCPGILLAIDLISGIKNPEIQECMSYDAEFGKARLNPEFALAGGDGPHSFRVNLRLPECPDEASAQVRHDQIESIIEMMKPAHTRHVLTIQPL